MSISVPESLLKQVDALIDARGFAGRSEVVRAALRDFHTREVQEPQRAGKRAATITVVYPEGRERHIGEIRHAFNEIVKSMMHAHSGEDCVEVYMLQGDAARIREFADRLRSYREARLVETVYTDVGAVAATGKR